MTLIFFLAARARATRSSGLYASRMDFRARFGPWALVTGASSGLGAAFAQALARRGLNLALTARRADRLEALAAELRRTAQVATRTVPLDLTQAGAAEKLSNAVADLELGLLVNNAGFGWQGSFLEQEPDQIARMVRLNCEAPALLARAFLPRLAASRRGGMILVASLAGFQPTPWIAAYGATKGFDLLLGEALAVELRSHGVTVLTLAPGPVDTEFHGVAGVRDSAIGARMDVDEVVRGALERLGRADLYVPGAKMRVLAFGQRFLPRRAVAFFSGRMIRRRMEQA